MSKNTQSRKSISEDDELVSIKISKNNHSELIKIKSILQIETGKLISFDEVITQLISTLPNIHIQISETARDIVTVEGSILKNEEN